MISLERLFSFSILFIWVVYIVSIVGVLVISWIELLKWLMYKLSLAMAWLLMLLLWCHYAPLKFYFKISSFIISKIVKFKLDVICDRYWWFIHLFSNLYKGKSVYSNYNRIKFKSETFSNVPKLKCDIYFGTEGILEITYGICTLTLYQENQFLTVNEHNWYRLGSQATTLESKDKHRRLLLNTLFTTWFYKQKKSWSFHTFS